MIREYRPEDRDELMQVWEEATALAHPFLDAEFVATVRHDIANVYLPITENWVWESENRVVGFISLIENEIGGLFVSPAHHRQGIGHALLVQARKNHETLEVEVFKANPIGRAFYEKSGFELSEESIHEATGEKVLRLTLSN